MNAPAAARLRILLVAYFYPPQRIIGARRPSALAKYLRRRGHDVTILTSVRSGLEPDDAARAVVRSRDLLATRLNWRKANLAALTGESDAVWSPGANLWGTIFVPDVQLLSWAPFAVAAALRLHSRRRFDVAITTSPVESAHGVGLALGRRGVGWVADLRDGWRFEHPREEWPLAAQRALDSAFERLIVRRADRVVTVSEPLSEDLRRRYGIEVETITNGFDPDEAGEPGIEIDPTKVTLVHTGGLGSKQSLRPLLEALMRLARVDPGLRTRVQVLLAGPKTAQERDLYAREEFAPFVRHVGFVERSQALAMQRAASVLLLVTSGVRTGEVTGKLFEYLAAGRPILVFGDKSAAADIVLEAKAGLAIATHDPDAAERALLMILAGEITEPPLTGRAQYAYPALTERYEAVIRAAIASANRGRAQA